MTYFMYLFCLIVWGLNFIAVKIQGTPVALEVSLTYRLAMTAVLFILFALFVKRTNKPTATDMPFIVVFGVCNFALMLLMSLLRDDVKLCRHRDVDFLTQGHSDTNRSALVFKRTLHARVWIGGCFGIIGVGVLIVPSLGSIHGLTDLKGVLIALVGTLLTSVGDASSARNAKQRINPVHAMRSDSLSRVY